jgi:hypothetical protein
MLKPQVNYIIGIGRSGTSLLVSLLGSQASIHTLPENYFSVFFAHYFKNKTSFSNQDVSLIHTFNQHFNLLQPYIGFSYKLDEKLLKNGFEGNYLELCKRIYRSFEHSTLNKSNPSIIVDKNPSNTLFLNTLKETNKQGKYILMVRDYRANMLSRKESIHLLSPNVVYNAIRWNYFTKKALRFQRKNQDSVLVVKYEDLVAQPSVELQRVLAFFGLHESNELGDRTVESQSYKEFQKHAGFAANERIAKKYGDLAQPIFTSRLDAWKEGLSEREIELCDLYCGKLGQTFGYTPVFENPSLVLKILTHLRYTPLYIKIRITFFKDAFFYYLPIQFKVNRFTQYVKKVNELRQHRST